MKNIDGILFVADAHEGAYKRNLRSWNELQLSLGKKLHNLPIVIALNKQDLDFKLDSFLFSKAIQTSKLKRVKVFSIIALIGENSKDLIQSLLELTLKKS